MGMLTGHYHGGYCPICERRTVFVMRDSWLRDHYRCIRCGSIPRFRALIQVLQENFPGWRDQRIHESSPGGSSSDKLRRECRNYVATHLFPDARPGEIRNGYRSEDLEKQTFDDEEFDLVITQDVFEHVLHPAAAFKEISRTLKSGGAHIFTVPWYSSKPTFVRAVEEHGSIRHVAKPDYHVNPIDDRGSLVVTEWGWDLCDFIYRHSDLTTTVMHIDDRSRGIRAAFIEVFVSRKH